MDKDKKISAIGEWLGGNTQRMRDVAIVVERFCGINRFPDSSWYMDCDFIKGE